MNETEGFCAVTGYRDIEPTGREDETLTLSYFARLDNSMTSDSCKAHHSPFAVFIYKYRNI